MYKLIGHGSCYPLTCSVDECHKFIGSHMASINDKILGIQRRHPLISTSATLGIYKSLKRAILENIHDNMSYAAKAKSQWFTRRKSNLVKKVDQLMQLCNVDLALSYVKTRSTIFINELITSPVFSQ